MEHTLKLINSEDLLRELKCSHCGKFLSVAPVYYGEDVGHICGRCYKVKVEQISSGVLKRATSYELLAKHTTFPCSNKYINCTEILQWGNIFEHENDCSVKLVCPFPNCSWHETNLIFEEHLYTSHHTSYTEITDILTKSFISQNRLIFTKTFDRTFLIYIHLDFQYNLRCAVTCIHPDYEFYNYALETSWSYSSARSTNPLYKTPRFLEDNFYKKDNYVRIKNFGRKMNSNMCKIKIYHRFFRVENIYYASSFIDKYVQQDYDTLKMAANSTKVKQIVSEYPEELECPVCMNYMRTPIYICATGHSICQDCKSKVNACPTCKSIISTTRNFALENLLNRFEYPCQFLEFGCQKTFNWENMNHHVGNCLYRIIHCPTEICPEKICLINIIDHFQQNHSTICSEEGAQIAKPSNFEHVSYNSFIINGEIFILQYRCDSGPSLLKFDCVHVDLQNVMDSFAFELQFINQKNCNLKYVVSHLCKKDVANLGNDPFILHVELLKSYVTNDPAATLFFKCFIYKV